MWGVKAAGAALVLAAGVAMGLYYSGLDHFRMQDLNEFKKALLILASEIEYMSTPLAEAMGHISRRTASPVSLLLTDFADALNASGGETAYQLWAAAADKNKSRGYLVAEDWDVITSFGKTLGYLDKPMQLNAIRFTTDYIDAKTAELQAGGEKSKRMYRSLGFIGGALLAVILW